MADEFQTCKLCKGRGHIDVCPHCNGTGVTQTPDLSKLPVVNKVAFSGEGGRIDTSLFGGPSLLIGNHSIAKRLETFLKGTGNYTGAELGPIKVTIEFLGEAPNQGND
jgi:hypothetical protein